MKRYIFIVGGVMSGIGKGIATASLANILKNYGYRVTAVKIDPYINIDAGTMNPVEHGEVFVTDDGLECDQDIGNYERFLNQNMHRLNYMTTGAVYQTVIEQERNLHYNGRCVEVVPHIPEEVLGRIERASEKTRADFTLIEIGGTVGEYQNMLFLEAARMLKLRYPRRVLFLMVSYLPVPEIIGEMKTKPTQHAVRSLNTAGIQPDFIIARSSTALDDPRKQKIATFCNVAKTNVISAPDVGNIYEVPINFEKEKLGERVLTAFGLKPRKRTNDEWSAFVAKLKRARRIVRIGIVGKYFATGKFTLADSYISVIEAVRHAAASMNRSAHVEWLNAEDFERNASLLKKLERYDGIIVPGGFGSRGVEGKMRAIGYIRKKHIPFLGICYGMQLAIVEFARAVAGLSDANSTEINPRTTAPVIALLEEQKELLKKERYGGSMRLGSYRCNLKPESKSAAIYGTLTLNERHRHRYELNNAYRERLEKNGLIVAGVNPELNLVEVVELAHHPYFIATQFHPEFTSRPLCPHPLFRGLVAAAIARAKKRAVPKRGQRSRNSGQLERR